VHHQKKAKPRNDIADVGYRNFRLRSRWGIHFCMSMRTAILMAAPIIYKTNCDREPKSRVVSFSPMRGDRFAAAGHMDEMRVNQDLAPFSQGLRYTL
jgi:hypothetical protein